MVTFFLRKKKSGQLGGPRNRHRQIERQRLQIFLVDNLGHPKVEASSVTWKAGDSVRLAYLRLV